MIAPIVAVTGVAGTSRPSAPPETSVRLPRIGTSVALTVAVMVSSAPSLLPRPAVTQALFTGVLMASALAAAWSARRAFGSRTPARVRLQAWSASVGTLMSIGLLSANVLWQNRLRVAMDVETVDWRYAAEVAAGAICVASVLCGLGRAATGIGGVLGRGRSMILIAIAGLLSYVVVAPTVWSAVSDSFSASNSVVDEAVSAPSSNTRSGAPASLVPWRTLGREGRKFVSGGLDPSTVRAYVGLDSAPTLDRRVALAVADLDRTGAFQRSVVVVAIPTGSGWVDENAVTGAENRFGGDVATVAVQFSSAPSWATLLFAEDDARRSANAVVRAVAERAASEPAPPDIIVYGQSLGAVAGSDAYLSIGRSSPGVCGAVWAGPPAGTVNTEGATVVANSSDPVVRWSADLLWSPPSTSTTRPDAPMPMWLPIVGFVQTSVDLVAALDVDAGHGHRYGTDQGTAMHRCR
ncbi:alpha/beta-hydrolase family protein [Rhodococcus sp. IEGM 1330]|uniref:alpha/beta-hydrolase family protein n=1 Tax=Rhodococcus sp. IEGM 1330 TaxID=3082225 RepID=UPI002955649A|nr:alpha/beta-hydrolase family protein [Rhodococcus sp. IEGM 1330]MDV8020698.1 alpha/beta-hydrolase family protein [Rhodococcus sp. IEGM 1330]